MLRRRLLVEATTYQDSSLRDAAARDDQLLKSDEARKYGRHDPDSSQRGGATRFGAFLAQIFPQVDQFKRYSLRSFVDDFIAALTIAFILLPQSIAYAGLAEADPTQALISASFPPLLYFIFGSSRQLSIGPEAVVSVVVGTTITNEIEQHPDSRFTKLQVSAALTLVVGVLSMVLAVLRAGFIDNILSGYLLTGFVLGTSNLIIVEQLPDLMGLQVDIAGDDSTINKLIRATSAFSTAHRWTILISVLNVLFLLGFRELKKRQKGNKILSRIPEILILVVAMILVSSLCDLEKQGVAILGEGENRIRKPSVPPVKRELIGRLIQPAITIVLVGYIECQTVTRDFGLRYGYFPSGDQELFALGVTNVVTSFLGGYPTFGSLPRSRIMASAGARTTLASFMSGLFVLVFFLTLVPALQFLPRATLASIVFVAALGLIETKEIAFLFRLRAWTEMAMFAATFVITLVFSISTGILLCLGLSALLIVKRTTTTSMSVMGRVSHHYMLPEGGGGGYEAVRTAGGGRSPLPGSFDKGARAAGSPFASAGSLTADDTTTSRSTAALGSDTATLRKKASTSSLAFGTAASEAGGSGILPYPHPHRPLGAAQTQQPRVKPTFVNIDEHPDAELLDGVILLRVDVPLLFYNSGQARRCIEAVMQAEKRLALARYRRMRERRRKEEGRRRQRRRKRAAAAEGESATATVVVGEAGVSDGEELRGSKTSRPRSRTQSARELEEGSTVGSEYREEDDETGPLDDDGDADAASSNEELDMDGAGGADDDDDDLPPLSPVLGGESDDEGDDVFDAEAGRRWGALHRWRKNRGRVGAGKAAAGSGSPRAAPAKALGSSAQQQPGRNDSTSSAVSSAAASPVLPPRSGGLFFGMRVGGAGSAAAAAVASRKDSGRPSSTSSTARLLLGGSSSTAGQDASPGGFGDHSRPVTPFDTHHSDAPAGTGTGPFEEVALRPIFSTALADAGSERTAVVPGAAGAGAGGAYHRRRESEDAGNGYDEEEEPMAPRPASAMSSMGPTNGSTSGSPDRRGKRQRDRQRTVSGDPSMTGAPRGGAGGYGGPHTIVLDFRHCLDLDSAATFVLRRIVRQFRSQGIRVVFCGLQPFHQIRFHRAGLAPVLVGNVFEDMAAAVADVEAKLDVVEWRRDD
ncbi:Solute carrier 26 [Phlyctochytrium bullatum]|nr:Solute carrier 26 [Phlyctochytrium bullatum]